MSDTWDIQSACISKFCALQDEEWNLELLQQALHVAYLLEFSTLPPYLTMEWSITDTKDPVFSIIHRIVLQEMKHYGLACNLLVAIGGVPNLEGAFQTVKYPGHLPGKVNENLVVKLGSLNKTTLEVAMGIEYPESGSVVEGKDIGKPVVSPGEKFPTIADFYTSIERGFLALHCAKTLPEFETKNQFNANVGVTVINNIFEAIAAMEIIKSEGEGNAQTPLDVDSSDANLQFAHYYAFSSIYYGKKLAETDGKWDYTGKDLPMPATTHVPTPPEGGYVVPDGDKLLGLHTTFTEALTKLTQLLDDSWKGGSIVTAIGQMFQLRSAGKEIMAVPIPEGDGNYCPFTKVTAQ